MEGAIWTRQKTQTITFNCSRMFVAHMVITLHLVFVDHHSDESRTWYDLAFQNPELGLREENRIILKSTFAALTEP